MWRISDHPCRDGHSLPACIPLHPPLRPRNATPSRLTRPGSVRATDTWEHTVLVGGVGLRRGRRDPVQLAVGDALDFWRVETYEPPRRLRLQAEMRVPGRAWLEFEVEPDGSGWTIRQTAVFDPRGLAGLAYWYALYPLHKLVFAGMLRGITAVANRTAAIENRASRRTEARRSP